MTPRITDPTDLPPLFPKRIFDHPAPYSPQSMHTPKLIPPHHDLSAIPLPLFLVLVINLELPSYLPIPLSCPW